MTPPDCIHLHPLDNVAVARMLLPRGHLLTVAGVQVTLRDPIPAGHKVALHLIEPGAVVRRYGGDAPAARAPRRSYLPWLSPA